MKGRQECNLWMSYSSAVCIQSQRNSSKWIPLLVLIR